MSAFGIALLVLSILSGGVFSALQLAGVQSVKAARICLIVAVLSAVGALAVWEKDTNKPLGHASKVLVGAAVCCAILAVILDRWIVRQRRASGDDKLWYQTSGYDLTPQLSNGIVLSSTWTIESQERLGMALKGLANECSYVNVQMASQQYRPLAERIKAIFELAGWQAHLTQVPLETYIHHTSFFGIEVKGINSHLIETVAEKLRNAGLPDVKSTEQGHNLKAENPKLLSSQHRIEITIGHGQYDSTYVGPTGPKSQVAYISGYIRRSLGMWIPDLDIVATNKETGEEFRTRSNVLGHYRLSVMPGLYLFEIGATHTELVRIGDDNVEKDFIL